MQGYPLRREVRDIPGLVVRRVWNELSIFTDFDHLNREMFTVFDDDFHGH